MGGKSPSSNLNLDDWLHSAPRADIYVLGYELYVLILIILFSYLTSPTAVTESLFVVHPQISRNSSAECW